MLLMDEFRYGFVIYAVSTSSKELRPMNSTLRIIQFIKMLVLTCAGIVLCSQSMAVSDKENAGRWNTPSGVAGPDKEVPGFLINLGPTGARAVLTEKTFVVRHIFATSPAVGRLKNGDEIVGVFGKPFSPHHFGGLWGYHGYEGPIMEFGEAIEKAESKDGKLVLDVIRDAKPIEVKIDLEALGAFSPTFPMNCKKSETIRAKALAYLANYTYSNAGQCHQRCMVALALLTSDDVKQRDVGKKMVLEWNSEAPNAETWSWNLAYQLIALSEYHLMTRDVAVLPAIQKLVTFLNKAQYTGKITLLLEEEPVLIAKFPKEAIEAANQILEGGFSHSPYHPGVYVPPSGKANRDGPNHYGPMVYPTNIAVIAWQLAGRCGATVSQDNIKRAIDFIHRGTNGVGHVHYGMQWFFTPPKIGMDAVRNFQAETNYPNDFVGRTGSALIAHLLSPEFQDTPAYITKYRSFISKCFRGMPDGHGDANLDICWTILGAGSSTEDTALRGVFDYHKYFFNMMRNFDGAFVILPNRDGITDSSYIMSPRLHPTATMVLAYGLNNPKLYIQGIQIGIPGIRPRELKGKLDLAYRAIVTKSYADSIKLIKSVRGTKANSADDTEACNALSGYLDAQFEKSISSLSALEGKGDFFALKDAVTKTRAIFGQIDGCAEKLKHFDDGLKSAEWKAAITVGTHYQQSLATLKRRRSKTTLRELEKFAEKNAGSLYGKRAAEVAKGFSEKGIIAEPTE